MKTTIRLTLVASTTSSSNCWRRSSRPRPTPRRSGKPETGLRRRESAKRQDMERLRGDVAAEQMYRVTAVERSVGWSRARVERDIAEARELLRRLSGGGL